MHALDQPRAEVGRRRDVVHLPRVGELADRLLGGEGAHALNRIHQEDGVCSANGWSAGADERWAGGAHQGELDPVGHCVEEVALGVLDLHQLVPGRQRQRPEEGAEHGDLRAEHGEDDLETARSAVSTSHDIISGCM
jgi:hypothetical protein